MKPTTRGISAACLSAVLFGVTAPVSKTLLNHIEPLMLAALLYLGAGLGLCVYRALARKPRVQLDREEALWFSAAVLVGGVIAPALLLLGLNGMPASTTSLLLNSEAVFTVAFAYWWFHEHIDRKIAIGMSSIVVGAVLLSFTGTISFTNAWAPFAVLLACLGWALDNNFTRRVSTNDASWIAMVKGLVAGTTNFIIAFALRTPAPHGAIIWQGLTLGLLGYGVSLTMFVYALRQLGAARASAYFSIAPFVGAGLAIARGEEVSAMFVPASILMIVGVLLHVTEHHDHPHVHIELGQDPFEHSHTHFPDTGHRHDHSN